MSVLTIQVENEQLIALTARANEENMSLNEFITKHLQRIAQPRQERIQDITKYVLNKNKELYKRLA